MMNIYARIQDNYLVEIYYPTNYINEAPDWQPGMPSRIGEEQPIEDRFPASFVASLIFIGDMDPLPQEWWVWDGNTFHEPPPPYFDPRPGLLAELDQIDRDSARPLRVLVIADPTIGQGTAERAELETLEQRAADLRAQLAALPPPP